MVSGYPVRDTSGGVFCCHIHERAIAMKSNPVINPDHHMVRRWFQQNHATIVFSTKSDSQYTLVCRPKVTTLIRDNTGHVWVGTGIQVSASGSVRLVSGTANVWDTTPVTKFYVATN